MIYIKIIKIDEKFNREKIIRLQQTSPKIGNQK